MMKKLLYGLVCCYGLAYGQNKDTLDVLMLNDDWSFSQVGTGKWLSATVLGTVYQDLIHHKLLLNPFYGTNEKKIQWMENEDWEYKTSFVVTEEQSKRDAAQLPFEGLDTYADVYLNGPLILKSDNMLVGYVVPVKQVSRKRENLLHVYFHSPIKQTPPQWSSSGFDYPTDSDHHEKRPSVFTRKAPYNYGWDWGIRMATSGTWHPVTLRFYDVATIADFRMKQLSLTDQVAKLSNELEISNISEKEEPAEVLISYSLGGGEEVMVKENVTLKPGLNQVQIPLDIQNPVRWMPNGWEKPHLYDLSMQVMCNGKTVAAQQHRIGLRTVRVTNEKDKGGESFYFEVNGIPMFVKGANYIPDDALLPNITIERYRTLFQDMKEANMDMVRIWGGGTYEDDRFYDLADENGVLVWQNFMFVRTSYSSDPTFLKRVEEEAKYDIKRLRNHASLAMWCGNNEILRGLKYWGW